jgi:hypothetical protein
MARPGERKPANKLAQDQPLEADRRGAPPLDLYHAHGQLMAGDQGGDGARRDTNDTKSMARDIAKKWGEVMVLELPHVR